MVIPLRGSPIPKINAHHTTQNNENITSSCRHMPTPTLSTTHRPNLLTLGAQQMLRQVIALQLTADV